MNQHSDSSGGEEAPGEATPSAGGGRGSGTTALHSEDGEAKLRFRYSRGTALPQGMMGNEHQASASFGSVLLY